MSANVFVFWYTEGIIVTKIFISENNVMSSQIMLKLFDELENQSSSYACPNFLSALSLFSNQVTYFNDIVGDGFAYSVGANFTPHVLTVNAGEVYCAYIIKCLLKFSSFNFVDVLMHLKMPCISYIREVIYPFFPTTLEACLNLDVFII